MPSAGVADAIGCRVVSSAFCWDFAFKTAGVLYLECIFNYDKNVNPCAQTSIKYSH